jgi:hypothetical protein
LLSSPPHPNPNSGEHRFERSQCSCDEPAVPFVMTLLLPRRGRTRRRNDRPPLAMAPTPRRRLRPPGDGFSAAPLPSPEARPPSSALRRRLVRGDVRRDRGEGGEEIVVVPHGRQLRSGRRGDARRELRAAAAAGAWSRRRVPARVRALHGARGDVVGRCPSIRGGSSSRSGRSAVWVDAGAPGPPGFRPRGSSGQQSAPPSVPVPSASPSHHERRAAHQAELRAAAHRLSGTMRWSVASACRVCS